MASERLSERLGEERKYSETMYQKEKKKKGRKSGITEPWKGPKTAVLEAGSRVAAAATVVPVGQSAEYRRPDWTALAMWI
ncbi:hypothetical protein VTN00DRAFT_1328 [Thermoascus crustaceus]|uniref:uncharacterized protein n=1 Tax=Thermoascus crustaceus TaxID=5088 RepID=UPI003743577D